MMRSLHARLPNRPDRLRPINLHLQDYVARHGGHHGGWDDLTHNAFVKLYKKYPVRVIR